MYGLTEGIGTIPPISKTDITSYDPRSGSHGLREHDPTKKARPSRENKVCGGKQDLEEKQGTTSKRVKEPLMIVTLPRYVHFIRLK